MEQTEFYKTPEGEVMMAQPGKPLQALTIHSRETIQEMLEVIRNRYPEAFEALSKLYTVNEPNRLLYEFNIVSRFIRCNFGEYDAHTPDVDSDGFFHFEEVGCPLRGECKLEGVVCKPKLDTKLTDREREVVELVSKGMQAQEIGERLNISAFTVCRHRENAKAKLQVRTLSQLSAYFLEHIKGKE